MRVLKALCVGSVLFSNLAAAEDVPDWSGELALTYGRNWGQGLNVGGLAAEFKRNVHPQVAVGVRLGVGLGVDASVNADSATAEAFTGSPLLVKGEGFLGTKPERPFLGLATGVTPASGAGAVAAINGQGAQSAGYAVKGAFFTVMPEVGLDLGGFRIALTHSFLFGSGKSAAASVSVSGTGDVESTYGTVPGLSGTALQLGAHFGRPK